MLFCGKCSICTILPLLDAGLIVIILMSEELDSAVSALLDNFSVDSAAALLGVFQSSWFIIDF